MRQSAHPLTGSEATLSSYNLFVKQTDVLDFAKYHLDLRKNTPVFAKCNVYLSAIELFYIQACPNFFSHIKIIRTSFRF